MRGPGADDMEGVLVTGLQRGRSIDPVWSGEQGSQKIISRRVVLGGVAAGIGGLAASAPAVAYGAVQDPLLVDARDFGVAGDGETDDTAALQAWIDHIVANHKQGSLPNGTYKITSTLVAQPGYGWGILGESLNFVIIEQNTDNIPILQIGTEAGNSHSYKLEDIIFAYAIAQPSTNTNANCILFNGPLAAAGNSGYYCSFKRLQFFRGFYGFKLPENAYGPWGSVWDEFYMSNMSGGLLDSTGSLSAGANNTWGRVTMDCAGAIGPIFKNWSCYNTTIGALEFINADQGPQLMTTGNRFSADIGAIKLEIGSYTGSGFGLIDFSGDYFVRLGNLHIGGDPAVFSPSSGVLSAITVGGGATSDNSYLDVNTAFMDATAVSGEVVVFNGGGPPNRRLSVNSVQLENGWTLQSTGGSSTGKFITVRSWVNGVLSEDWGDGDYSITVGTPNLVCFNTTFTAPRTITLPPQGGNNLCAGLYYDLIFDGAINGTNTAVIKQGESVVRTQIADGVKLSYRWRRGGSGGEWVLTGVSDTGSLQV